MGITIWLAAAGSLLPALTFPTRAARMAMLAVGTLNAMALLVFFDLGRPASGIALQGLVPGLVALVLAGLLSFAGLFALPARVLTWLDGPDTSSDERDGRTSAG